jgi:hypothetical protein
MRYFRADIPARALARYGYITFSYDCLLAPNSRIEIDREPRLRGTDMIEPVVTPPPDVITLRMRDDLDVTNLDAPPNMPEQVARARAAGQVVIYDVDDDYWKIPEWSPAYDAKSQWDQRRRAHDVDLMQKMMEACNAVTVSTEAVRRSVMANTACRSVYVCRNGIDPADFTGAKRHDGALRVGWMGAATFHGEHLLSMIDALDVLDDAGAEFWHYGAARNLETEALHRRIGAKVIGLEWRNFPQLIPIMGAVDIAIIPRWMGNSFAEGHSTSSGLEWAMAGVPYLATYTTEYADLAEKGCGHVIVAGDTDEWRRQLRRLLEGPRTMRRSIARRAYDTALREHGLRVTGERWAKVIEEVSGAVAA